MSLWWKVRGVSVVLAAVVGTLAFLVLPVSASSATPSPAGATLAAACFAALAVPVAVGWGCGRADARLEAVGIRPTRTFDFLLVVASVAGTGTIAVGMQFAGMAPAGAVAARAGLVYLGLLLLAQPFIGWRVAAVAPTVYLLLVVVAGRGEDIAHPAPWAWIAAPGGEGWTWLLTALVVAIGLSAFTVVRPAPPITTDDA